MFAFDQAYLLSDSFDLHVQFQYNCWAVQVLSEDVSPSVWLGTVAWPMKLAESILAVHEEILEVYILEERDGRHIITDEASKSGATLLAGVMEQMGRNAPLSPTIILGAAGQILRDRPTKLVGILYAGGAVILAPINEASLAMLSTTASSLSTVMQKLTESLPRILRQSTGDVNVVNSASEAESLVTAFLLRRAGGSARVHVDNVSYESVGGFWKVGGFLESHRWLKESFQSEVNARDGSIVRYSSSAHYGSLFFLEVACLIAAACLVGWILYTRF